MQNFDERHPTKDLLSNSLRMLAFAGLSIALSSTSAFALDGGPEGKRGGKKVSQEVSRSGSSARRSTDRARGGSKEKSPDARKMSAEQEGNVQQLRNDLVVLAKGGQAAEDEIRDLAANLQSMAVSAPSPQLTEQLASDLASAVADGSLSPQEMLQLSQSVEAVLASAGLGQSEIASLIDDVEDILTASGVGKSEVQAVVRDLQAIATTAQSTGSKGSKSRSRAMRSRG